jgi:pre-rRNA-processing protein IPI3
MQVASGLLLASWSAHYRAVTSLSFSSDSALLVSSSDDAAVHVFLVSHLLDDDSATPYGKPYGSFSDHTLSITAVVLGRTAGSSGGCCFTAAEDGTVKVRK